jgi:hypothetical protein
MSLSAAVVRGLGHASFRRVLRVSYSTNNVSDTTASIDTDELGLPRVPTWSVRALLDAHPLTETALSAPTLARLHRLAALIPPVEGTPEHTKLSAELAELVRLVEAVRSAPVDENVVDGGFAVPDGRVWAEDEGAFLDANAAAFLPSSGEEKGRDLLRHAARTERGLYVVEADRPGKSAVVAGHTPASDI